MFAAKVVRQPDEIKCYQCDVDNERFLFIFFAFVLFSLSRQVMESEEFMLLPANQLIDIISSDELNVRSEEQVFNAVMAWVKYSIQERRPQLPQVRFGLEKRGGTGPSL